MFTAFWIRSRHSPIGRAEMGLRHGGFWCVCYICATPIQRRCHISVACGVRFVFRIWSGARDLNPGPHGPEPCALPNCASPRLGLILSGAVSSHRLESGGPVAGRTSVGGLVAYLCSKAKAPVDEKPHAVFNDVHRDFSAA